MKKRIKDFHRKVNIHGVPFEVIWGEAGLLNFYGQGWPYHKILDKLGINFDGLTFVSKTTTLEAHKSNIKLKDDLMPKKFFRKNIHIDRKNQCVLKDLNPDGPGANTVLSSYQLHERTDPFQISFISSINTEEKRLSEFDEFVTMLLKSKNDFKAQIGLQLDFTEYKSRELQTMLKILDMCTPLVEKGIPIIVKISVEMPIENVIQFEKHSNCYAITISSMVKFGNLPNEINWKKLYPDGSPLIEKSLHILDLGGLSGKIILPLILTYIKGLRDAGFHKHINSGGPLNKNDVEALHHAGANSISLDSIEFLKPWAIGSVRRKAWELFGDKENLYK
ncbi:MAG: hypothetical protein NT068_03485 [Candidatus Nomurabacteria bacterium]|nr:hypothetical protein [Candidatus Nomurabacteria bacterium]